MDDKLHRFIMGALTNPRHPVYRFQQTPILQHYAVNVKGCGLLEAMTPEQWEKDFPNHVEKMKQVMALCEADETSQTVTATAEETTAPAGVNAAPEFDARTEIEKLRAEIAELKKPKPENAPAE